MILGTSERECNDCDHTASSGCYLVRRETPQRAGSLRSSFQGNSFDGFVLLLSVLGNLRETRTI